MAYSEDIMMEHNTILRAVKIICATIVAIFVAIAGCNVLSPPSPPVPIPPTESQQCSILCGSRTVDKYISSHKERATMRGEFTVPMECTCGNGLPVRAKTE